MNEVRKIIVLANSTKLGDRCVAGFDYETKEPIRLVTDLLDKNRAIPEYVVHYEDGTECQLLDIIEVEVFGKTQTPYQKENYLIDKNIKFKKVGVFPKSDLPQLFSNKENDIKKRFDWHPSIEENKISVNTDSLAFYPIKNITIQSQNKNEEGYQPNSKIYFDLDMFGYGPDKKCDNIRVTDLNYNHTNCKIEYAAVLFSSGEPYKFDKKIYTFAAGIIELSKQEFFEILISSTQKEDKERLSNLVKRAYGNNVKIKKEIDTLSIETSTDLIRKYYSVDSTTIKVIRDYYKKYDEDIYKIVVTIINTKKYDTKLNNIVEIHQSIDLKSKTGKIVTTRKDGTKEYTTLKPSDIFCGINFEDNMFTLKEWF